jgi:hypothetical protein
VTNLLRCTGTGRRAPARGVRKQHHEPRRASRPVVPGIGPTRPVASRRPHTKAASSRARALALTGDLTQRLRPSARAPSLSRAETQVTPRAATPTHPIVHDASRPSSTRRFPRPATGSGRPRKVGARGAPSVGRVVPRFECVPPVRHGATAPRRLFPDRGPAVPRAGRRE